MRAQHRPHSQGTAAWEITRPTKLTKPEFCQFSQSIVGTPSNIPVGGVAPIGTGGRVWCSDAASRPHPTRRPLMCQRVLKVVCGRVRIFADGRLTGIAVRRSVSLNRRTG
jgi:hypothetical protein